MVSRPCTAQEVMRIRELYAAGWSQGRLAREFQRTVGTVGRIVRGETHQQLPTVKSEEQIAAEAKEAKERFQRRLEQEAIERQETLAERFAQDLSRATDMHEELKQLKEQE